tara:strand:- start:1337 stop:2641 length:1305 start_codon:yes stop_codon:yes gene_type:complete
MKKIKICIAGLGNIGSTLIESLINNKKFFNDKTSYDFEIIGISAKNINKKRTFNKEKYKWYENPLDLVKIKPDILVELIGYEKNISYDLIKFAVENKIHVVTANKALLAINGNELFNIAEKNNVLILFEAAVAGGIPIIKSIKQSLLHNKIIKISGILNGTSNFILTEMQKTNIDFNTILKIAQNKGYAEANPKNDIEGIDSAHKLTILSVLCFGVKFNFKNIFFEGIKNIDNIDFNYASKLGYKIKLIGSSFIKDNKIISTVEPTLTKNTSKLANVEGVQNGIKIETNFLESLFYEGEGAGGKATSNSIISDLYEIANKSNFNSLGFRTEQLKDITPMDYDERTCSFYLRIVVKDIPGVLAKITSILNDQGISIETILQLPENEISNLKPNVPVIITTHETKTKSLKNILFEIEKLDFVVSEIVKITIDKDII